LPNLSSRHVLVSDSVSCGIWLGLCHGREFRNKHKGLPRTEVSRTKVETRAQGSPWMALSTATDAPELIKCGCRAISYKNLRLHTMQRFSRRSPQQGMQTRPLSFTDATQFSQDKTSRRHPSTEQRRQAKELSETVTSQYSQPFTILRKQTSQRPDANASVEQQDPHHKAGTFKQA